MSRALPETQELLDLLDSEPKGVAQPTSSLACARSVSDLDQELSGLDFADLSVGRVDERCEVSPASSGASPASSAATLGAQPVSAEPESALAEPPPSPEPLSSGAAVDFPLPAGGPPEPGLSRVPLSSSDSIPIPKLEDEPPLELDYDGCGAQPGEPSPLPPTPDAHPADGEDRRPATLGNEPLIDPTSLACSVAGDGLDASSEPAVARVTFASRQPGQRSTLDSSHARVSCSLLAQQSVWSLDVGECSRTLIDKARTRARRHRLVVAGAGIALVGLGLLTSLMI